MVLLRTSGLSSRRLKEVWDCADACEPKGSLTMPEFWVACDAVAALQHGGTLEPPAPPPAAPDAALPRLGSKFAAQVVFSKRRSAVIPEAPVAEAAPAAAEAKAVEGAEGVVAGKRHGHGSQELVNRLFTAETAPALPAVGKSVFAVQAAAAHWHKAVEQGTRWLRPAEDECFAGLWARATADAGSQHAHDPAAFLSASGLPQATLREIWKQSDRVEPKGKLSRAEFYTACKLVACAQDGREYESLEAALAAVVPLPKFEGGSSVA